MRIGANAADNFGKIGQDNVLAEVFVREMELGEEAIIKEMAVRTVTDVVNEGRDAHQAVDIGLRRHAFGTAGFAQGRIQMQRRAAGQMHGSEHVLKSGVLGTGIDPPGALKLVDAAEPLQPRVVDERLFGILAGGGPGYVGDVAVNRVAGEAFAIEDIGMHAGTSLQRELYS